MVLSRVGVCTACAGQVLGGCLTGAVPLSPGTELCFKLVFTIDADVCNVFCNVCHHIHKLQDTRCFYYSDLVTSLEYNNTPGNMIYTMIHWFIAKEACIYSNTTIIVLK